MGRRATWILLMIGAAVSSAANAQTQVQILTEPDLRTLLAASGGDCQNAARQLQTIVEPARLALDRAGRKLAHSQFADPAITSAPGTVANNGVALEVTKEGKTTGRAQLAHRAQDITLSLTLEGPISEQNQGDAVSDAGLADGATARAGAALTLWSKDVELESGGAAGLTSFFEPLMQRCGELRSLFRSDEERLTLAIAVASLLPETARQQYRSVLAGGVLTAPTLEAMAERTVKAGVMRVTQSWTVNGSFGKSREKFKFVTEANPTSQSRVTTGNTFSAGVAYARSHVLETNDGQYVWPQVSFAVGFRATDAHDSAPSRQVCTPFGELATQCQTVATNEPSQKKNSEWIADLRHWTYADRVATNLTYVREKNDLTNIWTNLFEMRVSYVQTKKSELGQGLPDYLLDTSALTVGARSGWRWGGNEDDDTNGAYFVIYFATSLGAFSF